MHSKGQLQRQMASRCQPSHHEESGFWASALLSWRSVSSEEGLTALLKFSNSKARLVKSAPLPGVPSSWAGLEHPPLCFSFYHFSGCLASCSPVSPPSLLAPRPAIDESCVHMLFLFASQASLEYQVWVLFIPSATWVSHLLIKSSLFRWSQILLPLNVS